MSGFKYFVNQPIGILLEALPGIKQLTLACRKRGEARRRGAVFLLVVEIAEQIVTGGELAAGQDVADGIAQVPFPVLAVDDDDDFAGLAADIG